MPWSSGEASKHKKGMTSAQKSKWSAIANRILQESGDEGKSIRIANAAVKSPGLHQQSAARKLKAKMKGR